jgi:rare lipoprotein A
MRLALQWMLAGALAAWSALPACAEPMVPPDDAPAALAPSPSLYSLDSGIPHTPGLREVPAPVEIDRGKVSWYGGGFHGRRTASGERFDMYALTAAHPTLPFGTRIKVRRLDTGKEVEVRINDRGPHTRGRILDLSRGAAQALGLLQAGSTSVSLLPP